MSQLRVVFFGTAELACQSLEALAARPDFAIAGVVTQPDRPRGRSLQWQPSPVKIVALRLALPILQPERARAAEFISQLAALAPDLIVVAAYGQILPQAILDLTRYGALNVHTSLLPKYRGAAPIQWAIHDGESETGVTIMQMDAGLDTGAILSQTKTRITDEDNGQTLHDRLAGLGASLLIQTIFPYVDGRLQPRPQPSESASYARKISKQDGLIDWSKPARSLFNQIRAFTPWPGSFTYLTEPNRHLLKMWLAQVIENLQGPPGTVLNSSNGSLIVASATESLRIIDVLNRRRQAPADQTIFAGSPNSAGKQAGLGFGRSFRECFQVSSVLFRRATHPRRSFWRR